MRLLLLAFPAAIGLASLNFVPRDVPSRLESSQLAPVQGATTQPARTQESASLSTAKTMALPACFEPNVGQWGHPAKFLHRQGALTMFLQEHGFVLDLREPRKFARKPACKNGPRLTPRDLSQNRVRGVAVRMTFVESDAAHMIGERVLPGYYDYFLGADESRWRTDVPRYASVLCKGFYPGIDVRVRTAEGHPEYDVILAPWADITRVRVDVEGAEGLRITSDGALVMDTAMGPITQPLPLTWQIGADGKKRKLACEFRLLGSRRFGFAVPGWDGDTILTIDPGLVWSTFIGGKSVEATDAVAVEANGVVTVAGFSFSPDFPTTAGAYDRIGNGGSDAVILRLDPSGTKLINSTYIGGSGNEATYALHVDEWGIIGVVGDTASPNFPTTIGAYTSTNQGNGDIFTCRLDPSKIGKARLIYSTMIGGGSKDVGLGVFADSEGVVTVTGTTESSKYPTTSGAYDTTHNGIDDIVITQLDPRETGAKQLVYSTLVGGTGEDTARAMAVGATGIVTVSGNTTSIDFPTTKGAFDTMHGDGHDVFVIRLDVRKTGANQLVYSTYLGGAGDDGAVALHVDPRGVMTFGGYTGSKLYPTTTGAYDQTFNGVLDAFVSRLDPSLGPNQLVWSTIIGGTLSDHVSGLGVDASGIVTFGGACNFWDFPTTANAYDRLWAGNNESIVGRFDPRETGTAQLVYSTYVGGVNYDDVHALAITLSGTVVTAGHTQSPLYPTTTGAFSTTFNGIEDIFVTVMDMDVPFYADVHSVNLGVGGTQNLTLKPGFKYRGMPYLILGSATGTFPGIQQGAVRIPLNYDSYFRTTLSLISPVFFRFRSRLDAFGRESASLNLPTFLTAEIDLTLNHALIVFDMRNNVIMASTPVPVRVRSR